MFVGAGVSTEAQLPPWNELVRRLLNEAGGDLAEDDRELWMAATIAEGPLAAAAIARAFRPDELDFRRALRAALYAGRRPGDVKPGALAGQIAWLKKKLGPRLRLTTANYDGLLEAALREAGLNPVSYVRKRKEPTERAAVWHLHGRLMRNAADSDWLEVGQLVLTEGDYARSAHAVWPEEFVAECLKGSLCVFVGLSMTDPNFIRWLYRYGGEAQHKHIAVFVRQGAKTVKDEVRKKLEQSAAARWERAGVKPVWTNYFGEVAQFVHEIGLRVTDPTADEFGKRAQGRLSVGRRTLVPKDPERFVEAQEDISSWLGSLVDEVRKIGVDLGLDLANEDLGLGLWAADHAAGVAELWGTSEQIWLDPNAIEQRPIHVGSRWVGVAAITRGVPVEQDPAVYTTRWRFIRGIPIIVESLGRRSVVGSLTLTSATQLDTCPLSVARAPLGFLPAIDELLSSNASVFFVD